MASGTYNADSITVLEGLEAVRRRPGMYIGGVDKEGLHHLLWEIVDNSVDEVMNGHASRIVVTLGKDGRTITAASLSDHYKEIFEITRLADFMTIYADEKAALGGAK